LAFCCGRCWDTSRRVWKNLHNFRISISHGEIRGVTLWILNEYTLEITYGKNILICWKGFTVPFKRNQVTVAVNTAKFFCVCGLHHNARVVDKEMSLFLLLLGVFCNC
jgi:hypothetical protein